MTRRNERRDAEGPTRIERRDPRTGGEPLPRGSLFEPDSPEFSPANNGNEAQSTSASASPLCRCGHDAERHGVLVGEGGREGCRSCFCRGYAPYPTETQKRSHLPESEMRIPPAQASSSTSQQSARALWERFPSKIDRVHHFILSEGETGATRQEISDGLAINGVPMPIQTVCSTVAALVSRGRIGSNPGHERASKASNVMQEVLVEQRYVLRWQTR